MISLKDILLEFVPYHSTDSIRQKLVQKHGSQELDKIAKSKNKVLLKGINQMPESEHKTLVCVREPGQVRFYLNKETAKVSDLPSSDIKGAAEPEPTVPSQNADPRIEKLRRLKDKLRTARNKIGN